MKRIIAIILIVVLGILIYFSTVKGINIGEFRISSVKDIKGQSEILDNSIKELNVLVNNTYPEKRSDLKSKMKKLGEEKQKYLELADLSSDSEIQNATKNQSYSIDYLWAKVGNHATKEGVNLKMEKESSGLEGLSNLKFTINGSYVAIINFISSIEKDEDLNFRIDNFKVTATSKVASSSAETSELQGEFTVRNISIKKENITEELVSSSSETTNVENNKTDNKNQ